MSLICPACKGLAYPSFSYATMAALYNDLSEEKFAVKAADREAAIRNATNTGI